MIPFLLVPSAFVALIAQVVEGPQWDVTLNTFFLVVLAVVNLVQTSRIRQTERGVKGAIANTPREVAEAIVQVLIERNVFGNGAGRREYERGE